VLHHLQRTARLPPALSDELTQHNLVHCRILARTGHLPPPYNIMMWANDARASVRLLERKYLDKLNGRSSRNSQNLVVILVSYYVFSTTFHRPRLFPTSRRSRASSIRRIIARTPFASTCHVMMCANDPRASSRRVRRAYQLSHDGRDRGEASR
jgi:hypothetical protein